MVRKTNQVSDGLAMIDVGHAKQSIKPRICYISYDGVLEPLGESQVLGYVERLAAQFDISLITFEKAVDLEPKRVREMNKRLGEQGVHWMRMRYHKWPPVLSTAYDVLHALWSGRRLSRDRPVKLVHARGYVAGLIALGLTRIFGSAFLFDMRGFWADEKVDGGHWSRSSSIYGLTKYFERKFFESAQGIVSLTHEGVSSFPTLGYGISSDTSIEVIPTCTDLDRFGPGPKDAALLEELKLTDRLVIGVSGTVSNWYLRQAMLDGLALLTSELEQASVLIVTRDNHDQLRRDAASVGLPLERLVIVSAPFDKMPTYLRLMDVGLFFIKVCFSKKGSCATKLGEFLATGTPVMINNGVGDSGRIVQEFNAGVVLPDATTTSVTRGIPAVRSLLEDQETQTRCRAAAKRYFDVRRGSEQYAALYRRLIGDLQTTEGGSQA